MIRQVAVFALALSSLAYSQGGSRPQLTIHTLVREDIFAGYMLGDMDRFQIGVGKVDEMLKEDPKNAPALAWKGSSELFLSVRAREAGDAQSFRTRYAKAREYLGKACELATTDQGVIATAGASYVLLADRLPAAQRKEALQDGRLLLKKLEELQKSAVDQLPVHLKGELLAGLAQAAERLGDREEAKGYLKRIVDTMPGTPYQARAQKWLDEPETAGKSAIVCQTCHEPGRLKNRLAAAKQ